MVEGPAELFLIPVLVLQVRKVSLDELGITVIPIYGVHFNVYAKLFGPNGITKKCAIIADGDLSPSDASDHNFDDLLPDPPTPDLDEIENDFVKVFACTTTFEREITGKGTLPMFIAAAEELDAPKVVTRLKRILNGTNWTPPLSEDAKASLKEARNIVLATAKRFGKARFAQVASRHVDKATTLPKYLKDAIDWLTAE